MLVILILQAQIILASRGQRFMFQVQLLDGAQSRLRPLDLLANTAAESGHENETTRCGHRVRPAA